jgi:outer membrane biosynthesis protein TonB
LFTHLRGKALPERRYFSLPTILSCAVHLLLLLTATSTVTDAFDTNRKQAPLSEVRFFVPKAQVTPPTQKAIDGASRPRSEPSPQKLTSAAKQKPQKAEPTNRSDDAHMKPKVPARPDVVNATKEEAIEQAKKPALSAPAIEEKRHSLVQAPLAPNAPWQCQWNIDYSSEAREAGVEGSVLFQCTLDRDGLLKECAVLKGADPLSQIVLSHVEKARCKAGELTMARAPMRISQEVRFVLERSLPTPEVDGSGTSPGPSEQFVD